MFEITATGSSSLHVQAGLMNFALALFLTALPVHAEHEDPAGPSVSVGTSGSAFAFDGEEPDAGRISFEMELAVPLRSGAFSLVLEADAGPPDPAAPAVCPSRIAGDGDPFAATSQEVRATSIQYLASHDSGDWAIGVFEARNHLDTSAIANDDKTQFAHPAFVNNPAIGLPGSRFGVSWRRAAASGSRGYGAVAMQDDLSGAFVAGETWWALGGAIARVGAWRGRLADDCEKPHGAGRAHGVYGGADGHLKALRWNLRAGLGRAGDATTSFLGVALELPLRGGAFGLAAAHERMVDHEGAARAREMIEAIVKDPEVGRIYEGPVKNTTTFGAFIEILPGGSPFNYNSGDEILDTESSDPEIQLDLARAYISMGDKEAARVILEEVAANGSKEQQAEARKMLDLM